MFGNPYIRIFVGAVAASYIAPRLINATVVPEIDNPDGSTTGDLRNAVFAAGITGLVSAAVYVMMGMAFGAEAPSP